MSNSLITVLVTETSPIANVYESQPIVDDTENGLFVVEPQIVAWVEPEESSHTEE